MNSKGLVIYRKKILWSGEIQVFNTALQEFLLYLNAKESDEQEN